MTVFDVIRKRHSYRGEFSPAAVTRDDLHKIVEAGILAPSGCNAQSTRFAVVDEPEMVEKFRKFHNMPAVQTAQAFIFCIINAEPKEVIRGMSFEVEDCSAAVENMLLAVTGLGYASVWLDGMLRMDGVAEEIGQILGLPDDKVVRVMLPVGVPLKGGSQPPKMSMDDRVFWNKYE